MNRQNLRRHFVSLQHRNYRLLWFGQLVSFTGSMMQNAAILWHVSLLVPEDKKGLALGAVGLVRVVPIIICSLIGGVVADALDRRRLMLATQAALAVIAGVLTLVTFHGLAAVWPLYALTALSATASAFDMPARQALFPNLVPPEHLPNAISLNSIMFQLASVLGPALGGLLIARGDISWVYAANAVSFLAVIWALLLMRDLPANSAANKQDVSLKAMGEGLRFVFSAPLIRSTMLLDFFATFFASAIALLPIFAQDILKVGSEGYGLLYAAPSVGAALAAIFMVPGSERIQRRGLGLLWAIVAYSVATIVFGVSRDFWLTYLCLAVVGGADMVSTVFRNIIRQLGTPDHLRGRMTGVNMVFLMGGPQLGELEAGVVADRLGAPLSVVTGGIGALIATMWVARTTPHLRHYRRDDDLIQAKPAEVVPPEPIPSQPAPAD
ncbi:MAG: MFS transporter [Anaerolineales bacterium]|nr:MFS transporter [Anaerolineales bacterium]